MDLMKATMQSIGQVARQERKKGNHNAAEGWTLIGFGILLLGIPIIGIPMIVMGVRKLSE